ncbi:diguanylate cyclase [Thiomicrorhabdus sediminis]|uniref:diguanylate cyclase n=1 Tax=Thiomicrorhabdus sediminis TaxID=2580412 RepID=A0A4P9K754_9GAMM|nr:diguanylate cyclase [Thiomicrorhabdus sediminis]QCU90859.1 diguanylate cyclase [Thiomicrorhabdus sediminis]
MTPSSRFNKHIFSDRNLNLVIGMAAALIAFLMVLAYLFYGNAKDHLYNVSLHKYQQQLDMDIQGLIKDSRESTMALALALAENNRVQSLLCDDCNKQNEMVLSALLERLAFHTRHRNLWIQVIDKDGFSRYRSWTNKIGDNLKGVREDLRRVLLAPRIYQSVSVGRFSMTFKAMVPLFADDHKLLGVIEVISHFSNLAQELQKSTGVESVILADDRFQQQLDKNQTKLFVDNYYVVNGDANPSNLNILASIGVNEAFRAHTQLEVGHKIITQHMIRNDESLPIGYWFTFSDMANLDLVELERLQKQYLYGLMTLLVLSILLVLLYVFKERSDKSSRYYQSVLDSASEIIFVSDSESILEANQRFFEFYDEFDSLQEFVDAYPCVCDTFANEEGYLTTGVDFKHCINKVLQGDAKQNKAKIYKHRKAYFFEIKIAKINIFDKPLYSVIMHDITHQEVYKKQLEQLSRTDNLTGISNRLVFNQALATEVQRAHRYHQVFCLAIFDIDHFKRINDNYGHAAGDQVLIALTEEVQSLLRETDVFSRIGGEEFTVIMPETKIEQALQSVERVRRAIENMHRDGLPDSVTLSFGVAEISRWDSHETLLKRADDALYRAKRNGRNRVEIAKEASA